MTEGRDVPALGLSEIARESRPLSPEEPSVLTSSGTMKLAARLAAALGNEPRIVLFTGTRGREGVSSVLAELGRCLVLLRRGPVLLLDAHAGEPALHARLGLRPTAGLTEVLTGSCSLEAALCLTPVPGLALLAAGAPDPPLAQLFAGEMLPELLGRLRQRFPLVLVDGPPLLRVPEAALLATRVDGVVAVVAAERTTLRDFEELRAMLDGLGSVPLGTVLVERHAGARSLGNGQP